MSQAERQPHTPRMAETQPHSTALLPPLHQQLRDSETQILKKKKKKGERKLPFKS